MAGSVYQGPAATVGSKRRRRRILTGMLAVLVVIGVLAGGAVVWLSRALPGMAAAQLGRLTNSRIETGAFDLHLDGSVSIDGLVVRPVQQEWLYDSAILRARRVYARFHRGSLLRLAPRVAEIRIEDFLFDAQLDLDTGRWNIGGLHLAGSGRRGPRGMPTINLERGKLRYCKVSGREVEVVMSVPIEARFGFDDALHQGYRFEIKTSKLSGGYGDSHLSGYWRPGELALAGGLSSTDIPSLERAWAVDVLAADCTYDPDGNYTLDLHLKDVHGKYTPEVDALRFIAPGGTDQSGALASLQRFFTRYQPTGTVDSIAVKANGNLKRLYDSEVAGKLVCKDISVCDRRFPYTIDHLAGEIEFTRSALLMHQLSGRHGEVDLCIEGWTRGFGDQRQYQYRVTSDNMVLDETLYAALQPGHKSMWDAFQPQGTVGADYRLIRTSPTDKRMQLAVDLKGVTARYREFPYLLEALTGKLYFDRESVIASDLVSRSGTGQIRLNGKVTASDTKEPVYYISIDANDVPLDARLAMALPAPHREIYEQLGLSGLADMKAKVFNSDANDAQPISFLADVSCKQGTLRPKQMPFALSDVSAEAVITPEALSLKRLEAQHGDSRVTVGGVARLAENGKLKQYRLEVAAEDLPLSEDVIPLLPPALGQAVAAFRPQGRVNLRAELKKSDSNEPSRQAVIVECLGNSICHECFAYPLKDVRGTVTVTPEEAIFHRLTARPAGEADPETAASIEIDGALRLADGRVEGGTLTVQAHGVPFTRELGQALPKALADAYEELSPQGPFDLYPTTLTISSAGDGETRVEFDGRAGLKACSLNVVGAGTELCGSLRAQGAYAAKQGVSAGRVQLAAERLTVAGKTATDVSLDAVYDPNARGWLAEDVLGRCYGGKALGDLEIAQADDGTLRYLLRVALHQVDLQQFLLGGKTGVAAEKNYTGGTMDASLSLGARVGKGASRVGVCQVTVADMRVGKVSPLASVLSVLRLNEPSDYVFERLSLDSYIRHNRLLIRRLDMSGRNVAFTGSGTMDLPSEQMNLMLTARGRRVTEEEPSILQSLTEGLSGAVVRMEVTGKADDPHVQTKTLPLIEDSLKILGTPE